MAVFEQGGRVGRRAVLAGGAAVAALVLAGCNSDAGTTSDQPRTGPAASSAPRSTEHTPSVSTAAAARTAAITAYVSMWRDMAKAGETSDWRSPLLSQHATADALSVMSRGMYADHINGLVTKGAPKDHPSVTSAVPAGDPTTVMISDCGDSTHWLKYRKDNGKLADDGGGRRSITAEVKKQSDGTWKVTQFAVEGLGSC